jgi:hypothetical protein
MFIVKTLKVLSRGWPGFKCVLQHADLGEAQLQAARLVEDDGRRPVEGLTGAQLAVTEMDDDARLPAGMREALQAYRDGRQKP